MVCERDPASPNDPAEGRIALVRDGEWLKADGTTLGADDGVAIAAMMALVEDESLPHGPLELLMTVAEEVGLEGANALDPALVKGSILVNLDSEEDGRLTVGCAGSTDTWIRIGAPARGRGGRRSRWRHRERRQGGHSGTGIALGRSNAVKVLGRALREAPRPCRSGSSRSAGGKSRNAIPRDAIAVCSVAGPARRLSRPRSPPRPRRSATRTSRPTRASRSPSTRRRRATLDGRGHEALLDAVALVPTGPLALSPDFDDLVETSTSLGEAITDGDELTLHSLSRSSNDSALPEVIATLDARRGSGAASSRSSGTTAAGAPISIRRPSPPRARRTSASSASRRSSRRCTPASKPP